METSTAGSSESTTMVSNPGFNSLGKSPVRLGARVRANSLPTLDSNIQPGMWENDEDREEISGLRGGNSGDRNSQPTMHNGMSTTVPQNMIHHDLNTNHQPLSRVRQARRRTISVQSREHLEMKCCRINVLLVVMQLCLGIVITALGLYMETLTKSLKIREYPYWAGVPLLVAGIVGIYFCATDFAAYAGSFRAFLVKTMCFALSSACIFVCMVAAVFPGIHGSRISHYFYCDMSTEEAKCLCANSREATARVYIYEQVRSCDVVITSIKDYLILQCALNAIASGVCMWFVTLLWKSRYQDFHSGLRFFSYSASIPPHP